MSDDQELIDRATSLIDLLRSKGLKLATAESCTGGLIAGAVTEVAGSSDVFDRGFVTYSNEAKAEMLGVPAALVATHGAVSPQVAREMAEGALRHSRADIAVAVTGVAGPGGGTAAKPVGLVYVCTAQREGTPSIAELRLGDIGRASVRRATILKALEMVAELVA
ncbi:MAG: CinA family protein [Hyphomicrobiaceae bacterium]